jgi:hypothetical protein
MYRDILTNKWFLAGIGFLVVFAGACYLYYQHTTVSYRQQAAELDEIIHQSEEQQTTEIVNPTKPAADALVERTTPTAEKPITKETADVEKTTEAAGQQSTDTPAETAATKDVRMSPHGFGPYPKTPDEYPISDPFHDDMGHDVELMQRVRVKLFNEQGIFADGISMSEYTGMVKYVTRGVLWIDWETNNLPWLGEHKYAASIRGHPDTIARIRANLSNRESPLPVEVRQITEADIPSDVIVKSGSEAIDPYRFLNLQRQ